MIVFDIEWAKFRKAYQYMDTFGNGNKDLPRPLVTDNIGWAEAVKAFEQISPKHDSASKMAIFEVYAEREKAQ